MSNKCHAEHLLGNLGCFATILGNLDTAAFATSTRMNLRLHDNAAADVLGGSFRFLNGVYDFAARNGDIVLGENRFRLILVNFHV